jgi:hypothetical protein
MKNIKIFIFGLLPLLFACQTSKTFVYKKVPNTPQAGFDLANSDPKAIEIADKVMEACGGKAQWDNAHYLRWTFFNKRYLVWDKWQQRVRIDFINEDVKIILNLKTMTGRVQLNKQETTNPDSLKKYLEMGHKIWINDSYWLVMPFKLKDSGVTLKFLGSKNNWLGVPNDVLQVTFKNVGVTPNNKYWIYVNPSSQLVTQWDYFEKSTDEKPRMSTPWQDYRSLGHIMLSGNRGDGKYLAPMGVYFSLPETVFNNFDEIDWKNMK